ncbi:uncharacterized protein LOC130630602 [Hydractinia symbiolongicarpus]|uniref:uncharacterized protein LOC130630602 n=1 Tax=Hydractinia symbiolongicarpus TaxID=13093 RepID=UPI00254C7C08|nr:uncharacterized protein LOC130630602 [Hydractinia symbiolongicarpus]XP_057300141.1 uncharacterized protein LOC130630602 [Hydractinia symbiolongicarpus]XP_057300143.1 uncharacterized protein LOC130630602 [Hydractinia symbiolongicarpus]
MYPIIVSEVARSYEKVDLMRRLPSLNGSRMFGYAFGPCISIFFINTNFKIGPIHVTYANVIGPILFAISVFLLLAIVFFMHDLSREYDLKADTIEKSEKENYEISSKSSTLDAMKKILKTKDTALVLAMSVLYGIIDVIVFRVFAILIVTNLQLGYALLNESLIGYAALSAILVFILVYRKMSNKEVFHTGIGGILSMIIATSILLLLYQRVGNHSTWYFLIILTVLSLVSFMLSDQTFTVLMCAKLAHSCNQGFLDGIRIFAVQIGRVIGALCVGICYNHMNTCHPAVNILAFSLLVILMSRKKFLSNPVPVI